MSDRELSTTDHAEIPADGLDPLERRVVAVDPITGKDGGIEVIVVFRQAAGISDPMERHKFEFMYHYLRDDSRLSLGLTTWEPPEGEVTATNMTVLQYVLAYFDHHGLPVGVSIGLPDRHVSDFEKDADLDINPEASDERDGEKPQQWVEGSPPTEGFDWE